MTKQEMREQFVHELAVFLVGSQAKDSISLEFPEGSTVRFWGERWAKLRQATPVFGWPTVAEAETVITRFLFE